MRYIFGIAVFCCFIAGMNAAAVHEFNSFYEGLAVAKMPDGELIMINERREKVFSLSELGLTSLNFRFSEGLMAVCTENGYGKYGFIDKTGDIVIAPQYNMARPFSEELSEVQVFLDPVYPGYSRTAKWGYIRKNGEIAIPLIYDNVTAFHDGRALVHNEEGWILIDDSGRVVSDQVFEVIANGIGFSEGLAPVRVNHRWGYIDTEGNWKIPPRFTLAFEFNDRLAGVLDDEQGWSFIDRDGNVVYGDVCGVLPQAYQLRFYNGWAIIPVNEGSNGPASSKYKYGYFSTAGKRLPAIYDFAWNFNEGIAVVRIVNEIGAIDEDGNWVFRLGEYEELNGFSEGKAAAKKNGKWGYINREGEWMF